MLLALHLLVSPLDSAPILPRVLFAPKTLPSYWPFSFLIKSIQVAFLHSIQKDYYITLAGESEGRQAKSKIFLLSYSLTRLS